MRKSVISILAVTVLLITGITVAYAVGTLSAKEKAFMKKAAVGGLMEVQLGQMAQQNASSQEVKDFGGKMVTDHGKANDELTAMAQQMNLPLPKALDKKHQAKVDKLTKLSGAQFDKEYMKEMVKDHNMDVAEFKKAQKMAKDADLKGWIDKTLPVLEEHQRMAKDLAKKVGAGAGGKGGQVKQGM